MSSSESSYSNRNLQLIIVNRHESSFNESLQKKIQLK
jgi:hypothetical protein